MIHERLDIAHWKSVFSLPRLREEALAAGRRDPGVGGLITGPADIALLEQARDEAFAFLLDIEQVPTDIFVWNRGEPERREVTKVSGLPYREAGKPWPVAKAGTPLNFVAQFCFADSRDIVPKLPGDLLLFFAEGKRWGKGEADYDFLWGDLDERDSEVIFEWVSLGDFPLTTRAEIPKTKWQIMPCYGAIYRTWDYPVIPGFARSREAEDVPEIIWERKSAACAPGCREKKISLVSFFAHLALSSLV